MSQEISSLKVILEKNHNQLENLFTNEQPKYFNRYKVIRKLGQGAMGEVFLVYDQEKKKEVALKTILNRKPELNRRFIMEIETLSKLSHPNIIKIYDIEKYNDVFFFTMEYLPDGSLRVLTSKTKITEKTALGIIYRLTKALDYLHKKKIIHRDIKPENIMMKNGQPIIADFGLCINKDVKNRYTIANNVVGTPAYLSPEQIYDTKKVGNHSDVCSLGIIMYELLSGKNPFIGKNNFEVFNKVLNEEPKPLLEIVPNISIYLSYLCSKSMNANINLRYSAEEMSRDIGGYMSNKELPSLKEEALQAFPTYFISFVCICAHFFIFIYTFRGSSILYSILCFLPIFISFVILLFGFKNFYYYRLVEKFYRENYSYNLKNIRVKLLIWCFTFSLLLTFLFPLYRYSSHLDSSHTNSPPSYYYNPLRQLGDIYIVIDYKQFIEHEGQWVYQISDTDVSIQWGNFEKSETIKPPESKYWPKGFVIKIKYSGKESTTLKLSTNGTIIIKPYQGSPPNEWKYGGPPPQPWDGHKFWNGYKRIIWQMDFR